jgi:hypothetical protein
MIQEYIEQKFQSNLVKNPSILSKLSRHTKDYIQKDDQAEGKSSPMGLDPPATTFLERKVTQVASL